MNGNNGSNSNSKLNIEVFKTSEDIAFACSENFMKISNEIIRERNKFNIALSGGSTPRLLFSILGEKFKKQIKWDKIKFYWVDERCVAPDDEESNYGVAAEFLFKKITIPKENIYRIRGEDNPEEEARRYSELLGKNIPLKDDFPRFDLILLGIGEDGHTASIFPDQMYLLNSDKFCEVSIHPVSRQKRITLTGKVLNNSENIMFLVTGIGKADVLRKIIHKEVNYRKYPASHIKPAKGEMKYYLDPDAASKLILE